MLKKIRDLLGRKGPKKPPPGEPDPLSRPPVHVGPRVVHRPIPCDDLDPDAIKIIQRLTRFDHSAYLVGGCVRDLLLDRKPKDFDIGTSATPRQIKRVFRNSRIIGRRFRLAHIYFHDGKIIEVATFRSTNGTEPGTESESSDLLIRDDNRFGTPEEDALRRDFTINSLFYDLNDENVLDHADGLGDLRRRLIRTIGDPAVRFAEDPIRILRAIKFAARLDFEIEPETLAALESTRNEIPKAAPPRILEELHRYGREGAAAESFALLRSTGVFDVILPELAKGYRDEGRWKLLLGLLETMDRRRREDHEISLGELLALLLIPVLHEELGWSSDGEAVRGHVDVRDRVERELRPTAVRLRMSRREQERTRQIFLLLSRMVPAAKARRGTRRTILRRASYPQALWILEALARAWDGEFATSYDQWSEAVPEPPATRSREAGRRGPARDDDEPETPRRRRRRRGGRRRSKGAAAEDGAATAPERSSGSRDEKAEAPPQRRRSKGKSSDDSRPRTSRSGPPRDMPKPWDDNYFFAALPEAPSLADEDGQRDRYGTERVTTDAPSNSAPGSETVADDGRTPDEQRPRRRRRRRRRKRAGSEADGAAANDASDSRETPDRGKDS